VKEVSEYNPQRVITYGQLNILHLFAKKRDQTARYASGRGCCCSQVPQALHALDWLSSWKEMLEKLHSFDLFYLWCAKLEQPQKRVQSREL
jgi:hypothetical protein